MSSGLPVSVILIEECVTNELPFDTLQKYLRSLLFAQARELSSVDVMGGEGEEYDAS